LKERNVKTTNERTDGDYIIDNGEMIIGIEGNMVPFSYYDEYGELSGFETEFAKAVCSKLGIDAIFRNIDWDKKVDELNSKNIDCVWSSLTVTEERRKDFEFSRVYLSNRQAVVIRKTDEFKYKDAESLSGAKISAGLATTGEEVIKDDPYLSKAIYTASFSENEAINELQKGTYDAIVIDYSIANYYDDLMVVEGINLGKEEYYAIGFRVGSNMASRVNAVILDMISDGSLTTLAEKYDLIDLYSPIVVTDYGYIMENGKLIIGIKDNEPPLSYYKNEELIGFDIDFAKSICSKLGVEPEFKVIDWSMKELELKYREIDCIWSSFAVTDERRANIKFSRTYFKSKQTLVIKKINAIKYKDAASLLDAKLCAGSKSTGEEAIKADPYLLQADYTSLASQDDAVIALKKGQCDAIVIDYTIAKNVVNAKNSDLYIVEEVNLGEEQYAVGFRFGSDMTKKVNPLINNMFSDGSLANLADKYGLIEIYNSTVTEIKKSDSDYIMSKGEIIVGIEDKKTPPMIYINKNGDLVGFDIDFASALSQHLGIDIEFKILELSQMEDELNNKNIDCIWNGILVTEEYNKNIEYAYNNLYSINNRQVVVIKKSDVEKYPDAKSLSKAKISAGLLTSGEKAIEANAYLSKASYTASYTQEDALYALKNGEYDAIVINYRVAKSNINSGDYGDLYIVEDIELANTQYAVGFRKGSDMPKKFTDVGKKMMDDGTTDSIIAKHDLSELFSSSDSSDSANILGLKKLVVGIEGDTPPMSFYDENGTLVGFDVEFSKAICTKLGIDVEYKVINWNEKVDDLNTHSIDCICNGLSVTEDRRQYIKYSRVYLNNKQVVIIRKSDASKYKDAQSLISARVASQVGTTNEQAITEDPYLSQAKYTGFSTQDEAFAALREGKVDALVTDYTITRRYINSSDFDDLMVVDGIDLMEDKYAIGFRINSDMTNIVNNVIIDLIEDGTLALLAEKYNLTDIYELAISSEKKTDDAYIMDKGEIIVGIEGNTTPMIFYDEYGEMSGFELEFARTVFSKIGIDVVFKIIVWDKKEKELASKNIDCIWSYLTVTEERRKYFEFSRPYLTNKQVVVIRKTDESKYTTIESLSGAKISAGLATTGEEVIKNDPYLSKAKYTASVSDDEAIKELQKGTYDAIVIDYTVANSKDDLMVVDNIKIGEEEQYAVGFRVGSNMVTRVNAVILDMISDGSLGSLAQKYGVMELYSPIIITDAGYIMEKGKMIIGVDENEPPMVYYKDNELVGFDVEFAKNVCSKLGIEVEFKKINWLLKVFELKQRNIDCIWSSLSVTDERREDIKFTRVYMKNKQSLVIKSTMVSEFPDIASFSDAKISAEIGTTGEAVIQADPYLSQAKYIGSSSQDAAISDLRNGKFDAIVIDYTVAKSIVTGKNPEFTIFDGVNLGDEQYAVGFRKDSDMTKKVNVLINDMINDGTLENLAKKYDIASLYNSLIRENKKSDADYIMSKGEIIVGIEDKNSPPLNYRDWVTNELVGYDVDYAKAIANYIGIDVEFKILDSSVMEDELNNMNIDCIWNGVTVTEEFSKDLEYATSYLNNKQVVVIKKQDAVKFPDAKSLAEANISAGKMTAAEIAINSNIYLSKANYTASVSQEQALYDLQNGEFDAIVVDYITAKSNIYYGGYNDLMIVDGIELVSMQYAIGFRKGSDMQIKFNDAKRKMMIDGTTNKIIAQYGLEDFFTPTEVSESVYIKGLGKMVIGVEGGTPPMTYYENGELIGFDVEFAKTVCFKLGIDAEFKKINWNEKIDDLNSNNIDCIWNALSVTEERRQYLKYSRVYLNNRQVVVIHKSNAARYKSAVNLSGGKLTSQIGSVGEDAIKSDPYLSLAKYTGYITQDEAFQGVKKGNFDALVTDYTVARHNIKSGGYSDLLIVDSIELKADKYAIGFRLDSDLTKMVNSVIKTMQEDGTLVELAKKYYLEDLFPVISDETSDTNLNQGGENDTDDKTSAAFSKTNGKIHFIFKFIYFYCIIKILFLLI